MNWFYLWECFASCLWLADYCDFVLSLDNDCFGFRGDLICWTVWLFVLGSFEGFALASSFVGCFLKGWCAALMLCF